MAEDDDGDINRAEHRQLMRLLEQTSFALEKGHAAVAVVTNYAAQRVSASGP